MANVTCWHDGCEYLIDKWGMCERHYEEHIAKYQFRRRTRITGSNVERFYAYLMKEEESGCWIWRAALNTGGYGAFKLGKNEGHRMVLAHRFAYEILVGPVPEGLELDHHCRIRPCVNPDHLEPVTQKINTLRGTNFAARNARKTHCPQGHEYTDDNTYVSKDENGNEWRQCKACRAELNSETGAKRTRRYRERHGLISGVGKGGYQKFRTHCPQGHEYTEENTIKEGNRRRCRTCVNERRKARRTT